METIFCLSMLLIVFAYFGYPLSLGLIGKVWGKDYMYKNPTDKINLPFVSVIIAAANEETTITEKLWNTIALQYPRNKLEIIVSLDGSTDRTLEMVKEFIKTTDGNTKMHVLDNPKGGKESAQQYAINYAQGEIFVFTDATTKLGDLTLYQLVGNFEDSRVGAVDGMSKTDGNEGVYLKYENKIREMESRIGGLVSLGGCLFAVRRAIVKNYNGKWDGWKGGEDYKNTTGRVVPGFVTNMQSDFRTALVTKTAGKYSILDRKAVAKFPDISHIPVKEFFRKHRTVVRGMTTYFNHLFLLNPFRYGWFSYQFFCHKLLKWLVPFGMLGAAISNIWLAVFDSPIYVAVALTHAVFYITAYNGWKRPDVFDDTFHRIPAFFVMSNIAILIAWGDYLSGKRFVSWTPTKR